LKESNDRRINGAMSLEIASSVILVPFFLLIAMILITKGGSERLEDLDENLQEWNSMEMGWE